MSSRTFCAMVIGLFGTFACAVDADADNTPTSAPVDEPAAQTEQAMSRCGYPPKRPWPAGCRYTCVCAGPVYGPFGEDPGDYVCYGGGCHLEPRADCAFEEICEND